jgi:hypothetical protein
MIKWITLYARIQLCYHFEEQNLRNVPVYALAQFCFRTPALKPVTTNMVIPPFSDIFWNIACNEQQHD